MSTDPTTSEQPARRPWGRIALVLAALAVGVSGGLFVRWWTHPTLFRDVGVSFSSEARPVAKAALSTTVVFPQIEGDPETVTLDETRAVLSTNTAMASVTFSICHMRAGEYPIYVVHRPERACRDIEPLEDGMSFHRGVAPDSDYLIATITPTAAGVAQLDRVELRYRRGAGHLYQQGTQSIRARLRVRAR